VTEPSSNRATLNRALEHFNRGFGDPAAAAAYFEIYDPDVVLHGFPPGVDNLPAAQSFYEQIWNALPDGELQLHEVVAQDDLVACRVTIDGTHAAPLMGVPPTSRRLHMEAITILRFRNGRVIERWNRQDDMGLMAQLGLPPLAAPAAS
jgi:ketosteroid isomerase-like protein